MVSKTLKGFPFPRLENPTEVETIAEGNFLSKSKIVWDTKSASRTEVYIMELFNSHFSDTNIQTKSSCTYLIF